MAAIDARSERRAALSRASTRPAATPRSGEGRAPPSSGRSRPLSSGSTRRPPRRLPGGSARGSFPNLPAGALARTTAAYRAARLWPRTPALPAAAWVRLKAAFLAGGLITYDVPYALAVDAELTSLRGRRRRSSPSIGRTNGSPPISFESPRAPSTSRRTSSPGHPATLQLPFEPPFPAARHTRGWAGSRAASECRRTSRSTSLPVAPGSPASRTKRSSTPSGFGRDRGQAPADLPGRAGGVPDPGHAAAGRGRHQALHRSRRHALHVRLRAGESGHRARRDGALRPGGASAARVIGRAAHFGNIGARRTERLSWLRDVPPSA